jgi:hypothetical protein
MGGEVGRTERRCERRAACIVDDAVLIIAEWWMVRRSMGTCAHASYQMGQR